MNHTIRQTLNITLLTVMAAVFLSLGSSPRAAAAPTSTNASCTAAGSADVTKNCVNTGLCAGSTLSFDSNAGNSKECTTSGTSAKSLSNLAKTLINIFSIIVGIVAVVMIIVGGLRYITSGGASEKISSAKSTLIYAIIGLIIVALAQFIVHFVLGQANSATG